MGCCHCQPVVCPTAQYDLRKRHEKVDPLSEPMPSSRSTVSNFDSLRSKSSNSNRVHISPAFITDNGLPSETKAKENGTGITQVKPERDSLNYDCDTISEKSTKSKEGKSDKDSDLGSEVLSMGYSSSRSGAPQSEIKVSDDGTEKDDLTINTYDSEELDKFDCSQTSQTYFGSISERPYTRSRLGKRQTSRTSEDSRDILHWKKGTRLGRGSFGTVWLGMVPTGELIAVKQIELIETDPQEAEKEYAKIYQEVSLLKEFRHKNIVGYLGSSYEKEVNHIISVFMQYVPGGSLSSIIQKFGPLEESITSNYGKQLLDAISYLHKNNIVHRDIKSANILLMPEGMVKLIDFGCAKRLALRMSRSGSHLQQSLKGTPYWMAPEVINETGHGKKSDIWSFGCCIFELLTGKPPWGDREPLAAIYAIGSDEYPVPLLPDTFSEQAQEFVQLCLIRDKHKRPPAVRLIIHSFLKRPSSGTSNSSMRWGHRRREVIQEEDTAKDNNL